MKCLYFLAVLVVAAVFLTWGAEAQKTLRSSSCAIYDEYGIDISKFCRGRCMEECSSGEVDEEGSCPLTNCKCCVNVVGEELRRRDGGDDGDEEDVIGGDGCSVSNCTAIELTEDLSVTPVCRATCNDNEIPISGCGEDDGLCACCLNKMFFNDTD